MDGIVKEASMSFGQKLPAIPRVADVPLPMEPKVQSVTIARSDSVWLRKVTEVVRAESNDFGDARLPPLRVVHDSNGGRDVNYEARTEPSLIRVLRTAIHSRSNADHGILRAANSPRQLHRVLCESERPSKAHKTLPRDFGDSALQKLTSEGSATPAVAPEDASAPVKRGVSGDSGTRIPCEICSATFSQRCHMLCHVRTVHEAAKNFRCPRCNSRFSRRAYLREHIAVVHEKRRDHPCPVCGSKFGWKSELTTHLKTAHSISPNNSVPLSML